MLLVGVCGCIALAPDDYENSYSLDEADVRVCDEHTKLFRLPPTDTAEESLCNVTDTPFAADMPWDTWASPSRLGTEMFSDLASDQRNFYSRESLELLGGGLLAGGIIANTSLDDAFQRHLRASILGAESDEWYDTFHASKELGNGVYILPVMASAWLGGEVLQRSGDGHIVARWGERSLRGFAVGAPPVMGLQLLTGGSRPGESQRGSNWETFQDNNGVSGHSFVGALPFITAAKLSEGRTEKMIWYSA